MEALVSLASHTATAAMKRGPLGSRKELEVKLAAAQTTFNTAECMFKRHDASDTTESAYFLSRRQGSAAERDAARKKLADCKAALERWDANQKQMRGWLIALGCDGNDAMRNFALSIFASRSRFPTFQELRQAGFKDAIFNGLLMKRVDRYMGARYDRFWNALGKPDQADPRVAFHLQRWRAFATLYYAHHGVACDSEPAWYELAGWLHVIRSVEANEHFWQVVSE